MELRVLGKLLWPISSNVSGNVNEVILDFSKQWLPIFFNLVGTETKETDTLLKQLSANSVISLSTVIYLSSKHGYKSCALHEFITPEPIILWHL